MRLRTFSSVGGLHICGRTSEGKEILDLRVRKEDLNWLAIGLIQEVNTDASPELIELCRQVVALADESAPPVAHIPGRQAFIKHCEDHCEASKRSDETDEQYLDRLIGEWPTWAMRHGVRRSD